jgi:hypothetical protein
LFAKVVTFCATDVEAVDTDTKKPIAKAKDRRMRFMVRGVQPRFSVLSNVNRISKSRE